MTIECISSEEVRDVIAEIRLPFLQVAVGDWLKDPVAGCSLEANGFWWRAMMVMHNARPYGHLVGANGQPLSDVAIARQTGCENTEQAVAILAELYEVGVPGMTGDDQYERLFQATFKEVVVDLSPLRIEREGVIYSRRMLRDQRKRVLRSLAGRRGWDVKQMMKQADAPLPAADAPGRKLNAHQERVQIVLNAVAEPLRAGFAPSRVARWIAKLGTPEDVVTIVERYPDKPADYIEKCIATESRKPRGQTSGTEQQPTARKPKPVTYAGRTE